MEYEERKKLKTKATEMAKQQKGFNKLKTLFMPGDKASDFVWNILSPPSLFSRIIR